MQTKDGRAVVIDATIGDRVYLSDAPKEIEAGFETGEQAFEAGADIGDFKMNRISQIQMDWVIYLENYIEGLSTEEQEAMGVYDGEVPEDWLMDYGQPECEVDQHIG